MMMGLAAGFLNAGRAVGSVQPVAAKHAVGYPDFTVFPMAPTPPVVLVRGADGATEFVFPTAGAVAPPLPPAPPATPVVLPAMPPVVPTPPAVLVRGADGATEFVFAAALPPPAPRALPVVPETPAAVRKKRLSALLALDKINGGPGRVPLRNTEKTLEMRWRWRVTQAAYDIIVGVHSLERIEVRRLRVMHFIHFIVYSHCDQD